MKPGALMTNRKWSDQEILDAIRGWAEKHGRPPKSTEWAVAAEDHPATQTVWQRVGGWHDALVMAGLEPSASRKKKFSRPQARRLRAKGLSNTEIAKILGVHESTIYKVLGPNPKSPRKPRNSAEAREARIAALRKALEKEH